MLRIGKVDQVLEIELDSAGFLNFFKRGVVGTRGTVGKYDRIGGNSGGQYYFGVGERLADIGGDGAKLHPLFVKA